MINPTALKALRERYPVGARIVLIHMDDPYTSLVPGDTGTITGCDDLGTLQMHWDSGSTLGLIPGVDKFEKLEERLKYQTGKAFFVRKAAGIKDVKEAVREGGRPEPYIIEKQVELETEAFQTFSNNLLTDYDFVKDNLELMYKDKNGIYHCLLVKEKNSTGGILTESEGHRYPRYTAIYKENE